MRAQASGWLCSFDAKCLAQSTDVEHHGAPDGTLEALAGANEPERLK